MRGFMAGRGKIQDVEEIEEVKEAEEGASHGMGEMWREI